MNERREYREELTNEKKEEREKQRAKKVRDEKFGGEEDKGEMKDKRKKNLLLVTNLGVKCSREKIEWKIRNEIISIRFSHTHYLYM
jgi:hypothetical protein